MRPDPDAIEASLPGDHAVRLLAAEVRRLQAVIASTAVIAQTTGDADWLRRVYADQTIRALKAEAEIARMRLSSSDHISEAGNSLAAAAEIARLRGDAEVRYHLHYAVPDAIAVADRGRNDNAVTRPGEGTGNTLAPTLVAAYADQDATLSVQGEGAKPVGERLVERFSITQTILDDNEKLRAEIDRLREAIRRLAEQDATLSVQAGSVTVDIDAALTAEEREAVEAAIVYLQPVGNYDNRVQATLRNLLERLK